MLEVARGLIGCTVVHDGVAGVIVETEAYHESEPACHAFIGLTPRTRTLLGPPGRAYVYSSYGIHTLFNTVCEAQGVGAGVLIRALEPSAGVASMRARRGRPASREVDLCSGPGKLTQALGITLAHNDGSLSRGPVLIGERAAEWRDSEILADRRIGISQAVELPWRFCAAGSRHLSRPVSGA